MSRPLAALAGALLAPAAVACDGLQVADAWIREAPPGAGALAAYATLRNAGRAPLVVDGVEAEGFGHGMIHRTVVEDGVSRMRHAAVELAPGGSAALAPGGLHLMLMAPPRLLRAGERVELRLRCGEAATAATFVVKRP